MKYVRRTIVIVLVIVFLIALAIGAAVATRVKNIIITYNESTGEGSEAYAQTFDNLQNLKGGNIFLLSEDEVLACVSDSSRLNLVSYKKTYPCTLEVVISERVETYCSYSDGVCYIYDEDGVFMYSSTDFDGSEEDGFVVSETKDGSPDVMVDYDLLQDENSADRTFIINSCAAFKEIFGVLRTLVKSVYIETTPDGDNLVFVLRSGLEIEISDCRNLFEEKIAKAYSHYLTLSDGQKTSGEIRAYEQENSDGTIKSDYIPAISN